MVRENVVSAVVDLFELGKQLFRGFGSFQRELLTGGHLESAPTTNADVTNVASEETVSTVEVFDINILFYLIKVYLRS